MVAAIASAVSSITGSVSQMVTTKNQNKGKELDRLVQTLPGWHDYYDESLLHRKKDNTGIWIIGILGIAVVVALLVLGWTKKE